MARTNHLKKDDTLTPCQLQSCSPFEVPVKIVQNGLHWLLSDPNFTSLKPILLAQDFTTVEQLRKQILSGHTQLSPTSIDCVFDEIDRLVDNYRNGTNF